MLKALTTAAFVCVTGSVPAQITVQAPAPQRVTIDVDVAREQGTPIPPTIFGTFLEPIGNSTYYGLWAEILQNPSFEAGLWSPANEAKMLHEDPELRRAGELGLPLPWEPLDPRQGNRYEVHYGAAANSWQSLQIFAVPGQPTGIKQKVYLPIERTAEYKGSFYAKHLSGSTGIVLQLRLRDTPEVIASQAVEVKQPGWTKYTFPLHVAGGKLQRLQPADFVIQAEGDGRVEVDEFSLMPGDALDGLDPDAVAMAKAMRTPLVRFGGNFTSSYHWRDGVGPRDQRRNEQNTAWGIPEYNSFGTDEFLDFCRRIGAQPQFALNMGSGTADEAAAWVRYIDERWTTHSGLLWEMGNELWGNWNVGYPTQDQIAERTLEFSKAIRAVDPAARLIATGGDPEWFHDWNARQLTNPPGTFNLLSTHFVVGPDEDVLKNPSPEFMAQSAFALPVELGRRMQADQQQISGTPGYGNSTHVAFTEWLFIGHTPTAPNYDNMGGAVITGGFLNMLLRNHEVVPVSDMTGIMEFAGIWKKRGQVYATPAYYVFKMFAEAEPSRLVAATADSGSYSVANGVNRLPDIASVPNLDVVAALSRDGTALTLFCVNRSLATDLPATIQVRHFRVSGQASIQTIHAPDISATNDEEKPDRVVPSHTTAAVSAGTVAYSFPHESVTVISLRRE
jgi:alpha-N-arabinofuranosidase